MNFTRLRADKSLFQTLAIRLYEGMASRRAAAIQETDANIDL